VVLGTYAKCPYSSEETRAVRKTRKARSARRTCRDSSPPAERESESLFDARIASEMRDTGALPDSPARSRLPSSVSGREDPSRASRGTPGTAGATPTTSNASVAGLSGCVPGLP
jgi:hypothetical protein